MKPSPTANAVVIGGNQALAVGQTSQLTATVMLSDGTSENVTALAAWRSSNESVATVGGGGLVSARANGTAVISAQHEGVTGTLNLDVGPALLAQMTMTPLQVRFLNPLPVPPSVNAGQCLFLNGPLDVDLPRTGPDAVTASDNVVECRFDASISISKTNIVSYNWKLQIGEAPRRVLGTYTGVTVTKPAYSGCGLFPGGEATPAVMQLTVTAADGATDTREQPFTLIRYGAC
jgi:hypothetical protein